MTFLFFTPEWFQVKAKILYWLYINGRIYALVAKEDVLAPMSIRDHIKEQPLLAYCPLIGHVLSSVGGGQQQEGVVGNYIFSLIMGSSPSSLNSGGVRTLC